MNFPAAFVEELERISLQGAVVVLLVLLAQWLMGRRLAPRWRCALWLLVMARLVLPVSVTSVISVFNALPRIEPQQAFVAASLNQVGIPHDDSTLSEIGRMVPREHIPPLRETGITPAVPAVPNATMELSARKEIPWTFGVFVAWLAGVLTLALYIAINTWRMARRFSALSLISDPKLLDLLEECRQSHNLRRRVVLAESPDVSTPALYGFFRPKLLLPPGFAARFTTNEMRFILLHETAHVKRWDIAFNWLATILQTIHWFNPVLWIGFSRWRMDRELACDALALDAAGLEQNREYGRTILRLLEGFTPKAVVPGLVGILEDKRQLRRRIAMIADYAPRRKWQVLALALVAALGITGLTDAQNKSVVNEKPKETKTNAPNYRIVTNGPTMKVTVLDAQTGQPLEDAEILAPDGGSLSFGFRQSATRWTTDKDGLAIVTLGEPPSGHLGQQTWFAMSVRHEGYARRGFSWSAQDKDVRPSMPGELTVRLEHGLTVGGVVRDKQGAPIAGLPVKLYGSSHWDGLRNEYSGFWGDLEAPVTTDAEGRWELKDFPRDLEYVSIKFSWPDGSDESFTASPSTRRFNVLELQFLGEPFSLEDLRADKAVFTLKGGVTVRGLVLDPAGRPLADVPVKAGFGIVAVTRLVETRTDAAGEFEFGHVLTRQLIVTANPSEYAVTSMIIEVNSNNNPVRLRVAPLQPLRMRVEDGQGRPLAGAQIATDKDRSEGQLLDFSDLTDRDGIAIWPNAPVSAFAMTASSPDEKIKQTIRLTPGQREINFQLRAGMNKELVVTARAHDARTGAPVTLDTIRFQTSDINMEDFRGENDRAGTALRLIIAATNFPIGVYPDFQIEARANGYATAFSPRRDFDEGDWSPDFALEPAHFPGRVVLLPDGSPASGALVWSHFEQGQNFLTIDTARSGYIPSRHLEQTRADTDGSFELPGEPDDEAVVFTHSGGFLQTTVGEIKRQRAVRLQPYGRVEGVLSSLGQPREGISMRIMSMRHYLGFIATGFAKTAADGGFAISNLPAGDYKLCSLVLLGNGSGIEEHQTPIVVKPGETLRVDFANEGRQIIGKAVPEKADQPVDWVNDYATLTLKPAPRLSVNYHDYASVKDFEAARDQADALAGQIVIERNYVLPFAEDGSIHADDVPAGTYQLRICTTKLDRIRAGESPLFRQYHEPGLLEQKVVVPPGIGPFDLGILTINTNDIGGP